MNKTVNICVFLVLLILEIVMVGYSSFRVGWTNGNWVPFIAVGLLNIGLLSSSVVIAPCVLVGNIILFVLFLIQGYGINMRDDGWSSLGRFVVGCFMIGIVILFWAIMEALPKKIHFPDEKSD